jgi:hypothetical protein
VVVEVSILDFAKFVGATTPSARIDAVRRSKDPYQPAHDFYKGIREAIVLGHANDDLAVRLQEAIRRANARRRPSYEESAAGYLRFTRRRTFDWLEKPRSFRWDEGDLRVRVNPEIRALLRGRATVLKLWFSAKPIPTQGRRAMLHLLRHAYRHEDVAVFAVQRGEILRPGVPIPQAEAFLGSEADAFLGAWRRLPQSSS